MSIPPPPKGRDPSINRNKELDSRQFESSMHVSTDFKGPNINNIKRASQMPIPDWNPYITENSFPKFNDGYNETLYYDEADRNALFEQTQIVRELELAARYERREALKTKYQSAFQEWQKYHLQSQTSSADIIQDPKGVKYLVQKLLGQGQFGSVYDVVDITSSLNPQPHYAVKVAKSDIRYRQQAHHEVTVLQEIQKKSTPEERKYILRMYDWFVYRDRLCIVIEELSIDLYEVLKLRNFRGLPLILVQSVMKQLLISLVTLKKCGIVHSDIKPENILLSDYQSQDIKLVDFGSSRFISQPSSIYTQSRYYRAPEVVLGLQHDYKIDIWSVACVGFEMFLAAPLFPGQNEIHLLELIVEMLGDIPPEIVALSPRKELFNEEGKLKPEIQICQEMGTQPVDFQKYFNYDTLEGIVYGYELPRNRSELEREHRRREAFIDLLKGMLDLNPAKRLTPEMALQHRFIQSDLSKL